MDSEKPLRAVTAQRLPFQSRRASSRGIAAHAAVEAAAEGRKDTTPYWRTLKTGGEVNGKYPGGIASLKNKLAAEGHKVVQKRKRYFVEKFEERVCAL
jgi:hypothetical protein